MTEWNWQVPDYKESQWYNPNHDTGELSPEEDRINVYCPHRKYPFLFGSFYNSSSPFRFTRRLEDQWWSFSTLYLTGDGTLFPLRKSSSNDLQELHGNNTTDLSEFKNEDGEIILGKIDRDEPRSAIALIRSRVRLSCSMCSYTAVFKVESDSSIQSILRALYSGGVREVSLPRLAGLLHSRLA